MARLVDSHLDNLRDRALRMGSLSENILQKSWRSVRDRDSKTCDEVQSDDLEIDRIEIEIDEAVLKVLALQAPVAEDLRRVIAIKTMATDLERVGDLARNIAKSGKRLLERDELAMPPELDQLAADVQRLLRRALDSFSNGDATEARRVLEADDAIDASEGRIIASIVGDLENQSQNSSQKVEMILIAKNLERVADHATNIAEDVIMLTDALNLKHAEKLARARGELD